ncbi:MAG: hypothetical protein AAF399_25795, partial [Bacteroidota bacterium]
IMRMVFLSKVQNSRVRRLMADQICDRTPYPSGPLLPIDKERGNEPSEPTLPKNEAHHDSQLGKNRRLTESKQAHRDYPLQV